jgi:hypothetical protein
MPEGLQTLRLGQESWNCWQAAEKSLGGLIWMAQRFTAAINGLF